MRGERSRARPHRRHRGQVGLESRYWAAGQGRMGRDVPLTVRLPGRILAAVHIWLVTEEIVSLAPSNRRSMRCMLSPCMS